MEIDEQEEPRYPNACQTLGHRWRHWAGDRWLIGWCVCHWCGERRFFKADEPAQLASNFWHEREQDKANG